MGGLVRGRDTASHATYDEGPPHPRRACALFGDWYGWADARVDEWADGPMEGLRNGLAAASVDG